MRAAELKEIWRQKADSHKAIIADLRAGDLDPAFKQLERLGMLRELEPERRHETLAADYLSAVEKGKSALVISPTHAEGERVTARIREWLKQAGKLRGDEREFLQLRNLQWTEAQRADARSYQTGLVVQFHQNVAGFWRGERVTVTGQDEQRRVSCLASWPTSWPWSKIACCMQRMELSFLVALSGNQRSLIPDGQPMVLEIIAAEAKAAQADGRS